MSRWNWMIADLCVDLLETSAGDLGPMGLGEQLGCSAVLGEGLVLVAGMLHQPVRLANRDQRRQVALAGKRVQRIGLLGGAPRLPQPFLSLLDAGKRVDESLMPFHLCVDLCDLFSQPRYVND